MAMWLLACHTKALPHYKQRMDSMRSTFGMGSALQEHQHITVISLRVARIWLHAGYPPAHQVLPQNEQHMDGMSSNFGMSSALHGHGHGLGSFSSLANSNGLGLDRCERQ